MSDNDKKLPPYRIWPHVQAAFGGPFGILNLLLGAVSIARQIARVFSIGLSPVLKAIFAAYLQIFHGMVDFVAETLSWLSGFDLRVPLWAHDWIILWFVGAGADYRVHVAEARAASHESNAEERGFLSWSDPPGFILRSLRWFRWNVPRLIRGVESVWGEARPYERALAVVLTYVAVLVLWPLILLEVLLFRPRHTPISGTAALKFGTRFSYLALFWLQTIAIVLAIFCLSVLNAQTM